MGQIEPTNHMLNQQLLFYQAFKKFWLFPYKI